MVLQVISTSSSDLLLWIGTIAFILGAVVAVLDRPRQWVLMFICIGLAVSTYVALGQPL
jgi:hypothetical protein